MHANELMAHHPRRLRRRTPLSHRLAPPNSQECYYGWITISRVSAIRARANLFSGRQACEPEVRREFSLNKQIVDERAHIAVELTHGLGDAAHGFRFDEADGGARDLEIVDYHSWL